MDNLYCADVTLSVRLPGEMATWQKSIQIAGPLTRCMRPLPGDRELPWASRDRQEAVEMEQTRLAIAQEIAKRLTAELLDAIKAKDTTNGYPPEE
jgi:hypothetical protein